MANCRGNPNMNTLFPRNTRYGLDIRETPSLPNMGDQKEGRFVPVKNQTTRLSRFLGNFSQRISFPAIYCFRILFQCPSLWSFADQPQSSQKTRHVFCMELSSKFSFNQNTHAGTCPQIRIKPIFHRGLSKHFYQFQDCCLFEFRWRPRGFGRSQCFRTKCPVFLYPTKNGGPVQSHRKSYLFNSNSLLNHSHCQVTHFFQRLMADCVSVFSIDCSHSVQGESNRCGAG